jgi:carbohydrate kinase (thermoresistant glucokinase family)
MVYIVMGVSGCGKSTVGENLAQSMKIPFYDGDDYHPQANIDKMSSGQPLNDNDREPWLDELALNISFWNECGDAVLACSALKEIYRLTLSKFGGVQFIYLKGSKELILKRMQERKHFMKPEMLDSQFATLEEPREAIELNIADKPDEMVKKFKETIHVY